MGSILEDTMPLLNRIIPFFIAAFVFIVIAFGLVLMAYVILFAVALGTIVYAFNWIRNRFFPKPEPKPHKEPSGRIIDSDDWRKL